MQCLIFAQKIYAVRQVACRKATSTDIALDPFITLHFVIMLSALNQTCFPLTAHAFHLSILLRESVRWMNTLRPNYINPM